MARPEVSCHPELLLDGEARTVVSAALCYWVDGPEPGAGRGPPAALRLARPLRAPARAPRRAGPARSAAATACSWTRTSTSTARARGAPGVGFYGKNTMLITREHGSWVVLGTLVTDVEIEPTPPLELDCGRCRLCIDACPTGALDEPGVLDATRCLSYWTQAPAPVPEEYREELGASVYGCDICQDVCPWNRGVEKRRADDGAAGGLGAERLARRLADPATATSSSRSSTGSTSRATTLAGCGETRSTPPATRATAAAAPARRGAGPRATTRCSPTRPRWAAAQPARCVESPMADDGVERDSLRVLAHELRSPVAALAAIAEAYAVGGRRAPAAAARARRGGRRRASSGSSPTRTPAPSTLARVDLSALVRDAVDAAALGEHSVVAEVEAGPPARRRPDAAAAGARQPDRQRDRARAGRRPPCAVTARQERAAVVIAVADEGEGIAPDDLLRIFEPGVRATERASGLGSRARGRAHGRAGARGQGGGASRAPVRGRRSGSCCRPLPAGAEAELRCSVVGPRGDAPARRPARARPSRPRRPSTSDSSHSSVLNGRSETAALSVRRRAPRSSFQRATTGECQSRAMRGSRR